MRVDLTQDPLASPQSVFIRGQLVTNSDGTFSIQNDDHTYASQVPNQYGSFNRAGAIGPWEKFALDGVIATFWPTSASTAYSYVLRHLPNY